VTRTRLNSAARREVIVAAARSVFLDDGYSGARTKLIAERSGITEAILYRHFASKEELFEASVVAPLSDLLDDLLDRSRTIMATDDPVELRIHRLEQAWIELSMQIVPLLGVALFSDQQHGQRRYRELVMPFLASMLEATSGSGLIPPEAPGTSGAVIVNAAFGMNLMLAVDQLASSKEPDVAGLAGQITDLFFLGLSEARSLGLR